MPEAVTHYIEPLSTRPSLTRLGGKGRSLASLVGAGFAVPDGFCVTTAAYRAFLTANGLADALMQLAKPRALEGRLSFAAAAAEIAARIEAGEWPASLREAVVNAHHPFSSAPVAVRSSATAEDLPELSFAGQQDTYLNVMGCQALLNAIRSCWASLWSERAMSYRHEMAIAGDDVAIAVVVQRMVNADVSGVLFTANPATGERSEMIVNASYGLGEAIVSGEVTPDAYIIERPSLAVRAVTVGAKERMVVADADHGTRLTAVAAERQAAESLDRAQLDELGRLALAVETHFEGVPQDIEWLFAANKLWLLQSRPITNLPPPPLRDVRWEPPEPGAYLGRSQLVEHIPDPVSTLFEDLHMKRSLQHYWGLNLSSRGNHDYEDTQPPACFVVQTTLNGYAYRHLGEPPRSGRLGSNTRSSMPLLKKLKAQWLKYWMQVRLYVWFVPQWRFIALPRYLKEINRWRTLAPQRASVEQLWKGIRALSRADARYWYRGGVWNAFALTRGTESQLHDFLQTHTGGKFTSGQLLAGMVSVAFQGQIMLWQIAQRIRANAAVLAAVVETPPQRMLEMLRTRSDAREVLASLDDYFTSRGHQIFSLDFAEPGEAESPARTMRSLHSLVLLEHFDPLERQRNIVAQRKATERAVLASLHGSLRWRFRWLLWKARYFYPNREAAMFHMGRAWTVLRPFARELGSRLTNAGTLANADDVYFLDCEELGRAIRASVAAQQASRRGMTMSPTISQYAERASERRQLREARRRLSPPGHVPGPPPWARPAEPQHEAASAASLLKGSPVSPGKVTAPASLVLSPADFTRMRPGTILVCPTTTPAWTQLFPQAVGLVTDIGGILAHGSIVAREYGIPAVLGAVDATRRIAHDQLITVDGDRGTVTIERDQLIDTE